MTWSDSDKEKKDIPDAARHTHMGLWHERSYPTGLAHRHRTPHGARLYSYKHRTPHLCLRHFALAGVWGLEPRRRAVPRWWCARSAAVLRRPLLAAGLMPQKQQKLQSYATALPHGVWRIERFLTRFSGKIYTLSPKRSERSPRRVVVVASSNKTWVGATWPQNG